MEDFLNTAHWLLIPFGPFSLVVLLAIPCAIIALLVVLIKKTHQDVEKLGS